MYQDVILKGDGEPALVQELENVNLPKKHPPLLPAYDPQTNGAEEKGSSGLHGTSKGREDWAGSAVEVQSGVRL